MSQVNKIEVEDELHRFMQLHGFKNIKDILKITPAKLLQMPGFGYRQLNYLFNPYNAKGINVPLND